MENRPVPLVVVEQRDGALGRNAREAVAAAQQLGRVTVIVPGASVEAAAAVMAEADVAEVVKLEHPALATYTADGFVEALAAFLPAIDASHIVFAHTYQSRDFVPRLAARLDRPLVSDCVGIALSNGEARFIRQLFQGKLQAEVVATGPPPHLVTVQAGAFPADRMRLGDVPAPIRAVTASLDPAAIRQRPEPPFREARQTVDLGQADRIVAVGRGIGAEEHMAMIRRLAAALGAELGASRPVCDAGWLPLERQIGSSGQTVAPRLYVAIGISGAIQHVVGMRGARTICAINRDPDAPVFEIADYGIVGDLFEVVPALIEALEA